MKMSLESQNSKHTSPLTNAYDNCDHKIKSSRYSEADESVSSKNNKISSNKRQRLDSNERTSSPKHHSFAEANGNYNSGEKNKHSDKRKDRSLRRDKQRSRLSHRRFEKEEPVQPKRYHVAPEDDPTATKNLYVGNLDNTITISELLHVFERYGVVETIDIKHLPYDSSYAFVTMTTLNMAYKAKTKLSEKYIGRSRCKIGYGRIIPSSIVWVGGLKDQIKNDEIKKPFDRFGKVLRIEHCRSVGEAQIWYKTSSEASEAVNSMRGRLLPGYNSRLRTDFGDNNFTEYLKRQTPSSDNDLELVSVYRQHFSDVLKQSPKWNGDFILKCHKHAVKLYLLESNKKNLDNLLKDVDQLEIAYKLRLELPKLENIQEKISNSKSCQIFLGLPNIEDVTKRPLSELVTYLVDKSVVGFLHLSNEEGITLGFFYIFPPCDFAFDLIRRTHQVSETEIQEFLVCVSILRP